MTARAPRPPADLARGGPGRRLWTAVLADFELDGPDLAVLTEMCRCTDELERLRADLAEQSTTVVGSAGQPRPNPLLDELRRHRDTLARLTKALSLPDDVQEAPRVTSATSAAAKKAADTRWKMERARAARGAS